MATSQPPQPHRETLPFFEEMGDGCHDGQPVSLERYVNTLYHPDCDSVDGRLQERNVGELEHSRLQKRLLALFLQNETEWKIEVLQEQRMQVSPTDFRIPDLMLLPAGNTEHRIVRNPPILCVEILSPEDTHVSTKESEII